MSFSCKKCGFCCKNGIIVLYPEDINSISHYLGLKQEAFVKNYCKKERIPINKLDCLDIYYLDVSDSCVFLSNENLCEINVVKPLQCRLAPESYFNSIGTWKNCIQFCEQEENPFSNNNFSDEFFVEKLLKGYSFD